MDTAIALVMTSTLATAGIAAIWASTSRRHWFVGMAAYFALISPLLLIPAYEPLVVLVIEGAVVAAGLALGRRLSLNRRNATQAASLPSDESRLSWRGPQFSLSTLLLAMIPFGIAAIIVTRLPTLNRYAWQSMCLIGVAGGVSTLLGYWAATRATWPRKAGAIVAAIFTAFVLSLGLAWFDWMVPAIAGVGSWPPEPPDPSVTFPFMSFDRPIKIWFAILPAVTLITTIAVWLAASCTSSVAPLRPARRTVSTLVVRAVTAIAVLVIALPAIYVLYRLLTPEPIPAATPPSPNGYRELIAAGESTVNMIVDSGSYDPDTATRRQIAAAAKQVAPVVARARAALELPCEKLVDYSNSDSLLEIQHVRSLARAFYAVGKQASIEGNFRGAVDAHLDNVRVGHRIQRGALIVDGLVGNAIASIGCSGLFEIHDKLEPELCRVAILALKEAPSHGDSYEALEYRDYVWSMYAYGWHGRLYTMLSYATGDSEVGRYKYVFVANEARVNLLIAHLMLRLFLAERGQFPANWGQVVAAGFEPLPRDPFDAEEGSIRYRRTDNGFVLYSVGLNGVDEHGAKPAADDYANNCPSTGDMRLDVVYGPDPPSQPSADDGGNADEKGDGVEAVE